MLNPFSLAFPTHWFSPSLHLPFSHVYTFSIPALPLILPPLFLPPTYTVTICTFWLLPLACSSLRRQSPSPLYLPSLTQNVTRKESLNLDTPIKTFLLDLAGLASSHSSMDHVCGSWTSLLLLLFSPAHSSPSSHVSSHSHCCPTQFPPHPFPSYHYSPLTQVSSATPKATLYHFKSFMSVSLQLMVYTISRPLSPSPPCF